LRISLQRLARPLEQFANRSNKLVPGHWDKNQASRICLPPTTPKKSRNMSMFFWVGIFFLRHSEEVSVDLFTYPIWDMAEKDEDVIALGEFSGLDRQRGEM
jgi:hypothetical protein